MTLQVEESVPMTRTSPTFADIVPIKQLASHEYSIQIRDQWCIGTVPNGGYITSTFLIVARTHMQTTHSTVPAPNPINLHLEFFRRTQVGLAIFKVKDIKLGSRISNLHIVLSQEQEDGTWQNEVEGYVTLSNIAQESGISLETGYELHPFRLPADLDMLARTGEDENYRLRAIEPFPEFRRAALNLQMYLVKPERKPRDRVKSVIDQWVRFAPGRKPGGRWTNDALGFVIDIFPQIVEQYLNPVLEDAAISAMSEKEFMKTAHEHRKNAKYWYPTLALNLDIKKVLPEEGVEWLFIRVKSKAIRNGRYDLEVEVWDKEDELVASSNHASLILDATRNTSRKGKKTPASKL